MFRNIKVNFLFIFLIFISNNLFAYEMSNTAEAIHQAVRIFFEDKNIEGSAKIDPLIKKKLCTSDLRVSRHRGQLRTLLISCNENNGWDLLVSTRINDRKLVKKTKNLHSNSNANLSNFPAPGRKVWVTTRTLRKGTVLMPNHIKLDFLKGSKAQVFYNNNPPLGRQLKRTITEGKPIRERQLMPSWDIEKGESATLESNYGKINIFTSVKSLENAFIGERVRVLNLTSNKELLAYLKKNNIFQLEPLKILDYDR